MPSPLYVLPVSNTLGEGIVWDAETERVWWTDIQESLLYRHDPKSGAVEKFSLPERLGSFGLIENSKHIIGAFETGFARYHPETCELSWIARPLPKRGGVRFNDGRVDRHGRFWAGTMVEDQGSPRAALFRLSASGDHEICERDIAISNSICFSPDGRALYFADSPNRIIYRYSLDPASGRISDRAIFARTPEGAFPDGAQVDSEGFVWCAHWGAGKVARYSPEGDVSKEIALPVSQPTCVTFGGSDLGLLFVTSAKDGLSAEELERQPQAGDVFVYRSTVPGLPEGRFVWNGHVPAVPNPEG